MRKLFLLVFLLPVLAKAQFTLDRGFGLGNTGSDVFSSILVDTAGNIYCAGSFEMFIDADPGAASSLINSLGGKDAFLAKYDPNGNLIWAKGLGGTGYDEVGAMQLDNSGNVYLAGCFEGTGNFGGSTLTSIGTYDLYIAKYDSSGQHLWSRSYGGTDESTQIQMAVSTSGNQIAICGSFSGTMDLGSGNLNCLGNTSGYVAMLNSTGDTQWSYAIGANGIATDRSTAITLNTAGDVYVSGITSGTNLDVDPGSGTHYISSNGSSDIYLIKYDSNGLFQNAFSIGGTRGELPFDIEVTQNGDIFLTGYSNSDSIDVNPDSLATNYLYGDSTINFVQDIFLLKLDNNNNYQWSFRIGKRASDSGRGIKVDQSGNVILAGIVGDSAIDFDPGPGVYQLSGDPSNLSNNSVFLAQYTSNGEFVGAFTFEDSLNFGSLFLSDDGKAWVSGSFRSATSDLDPGPGVSTITNNGMLDGFIASYNYPFTSSISEQSENEISYFPNPCNKYLKLNLEPTGQNVKIYSVSGVMVLSLKFLQDKIDVSDLLPGLYMIKVEGKDSSSNFMVIKN